MKSRFLFAFLGLICVLPMAAQRRCASAQYQQHALAVNPFLPGRQLQIETFIRSHMKSGIPAPYNARPALTTIRIPVIVHIIYHEEEENISTASVNRQIAAMNRDFQRSNADSNNTPDVFKSLAADCSVQFELATVDPLGRASTGIERIHSPVAHWEIEGDKVKFSREHGVDGWDSRYYLNIWVCNLDDLLGYSSVLGDDEKKDGIVIHYAVFDNLEDGEPYHSGRTAVHETGHWLSLKHLWGDADCGDDDVADTPKQATFTTGCPGGVRLSCGNSPVGDMYMNFMDYTNDPCMNLFTKGQRDRLRTLFDPGGPRNSILSSTGLGLPWVAEVILPDETPKWLYPKLYPNPAGNQVVLDLAADPGWIGQELQITNVNGQVIMHHAVVSTVETINISALSTGIYFIRGNKQGGKLAEKFVKIQ